MTTFDPRPPIVIGNWKQNTTRAQAEALARAVAGEAIEGVQRAVCPPAIWLSTVSGALDGSDVALGAQTSAATPDGAHTGEISAGMIAELCSFVLVGHSERRRRFGESDAVVADKLRLAREAGLGVVLCVGETAEQREAGDAERVVLDQLASALAAAGATSPDVVVAYEPVWAIGTGRSATPDDAAEMAGAIAAGLTRTLPGAEIPILYGGSVDAANAADLMAGEHVGGFLVGGASLRADAFLSICRAARRHD